MLSRDTAEKYLDVLLQVLHAIDELVDDKLLPAETALQGVKAALAALDDDKIASVKPEDIRELAKTLREDLAARRQANDQRLHDRFDVAPKLDDDGTDES